MAMRKLKKKSSVSTKKPSFFKIMIGDFDQKLRVPTTFIRLFHGKLPHQSILTSPTGSSWTIKVTKIDKDLFFSDGWKAFVNDHSLEFGDFLVFRYNGESKFKVKIYGRTGCEKEVRFNHEDPIMSNVKKQEKHEQEPMLNVKKREKEGQRKHAMEIKERARAVVATSSIKTKHPHFIAIWRHSRKYHLTIPRALAIKSGLKTKKSIVLQDPVGRSWPVSISRRADDRIDMTKGWKNFCKGNELSVGDTCLFEFLNRREGNKVSVRIFRKAEVEIPASLRLSKRPISTATLNLLTADDDTQNLDFELKKGKVKFPKTTYATTLAEERAIKAADAFKSEKPFCTIIMRPSYVHYPFTMTVPSKFGNAYLMGKTQIVTLRVSDEGRTWQVRCSYSENHTKLVKGWKDFVSHNHLEEGDVCVFELVEKKKIEMNVSIFRVSHDVV